MGIAYALNAHEAHFSEAVGACREKTLAKLWQSFGDGEKPQSLAMCLLCSAHGEWSRGMNFRRRLNFRLR